MADEITDDELFELYDPSDCDGIHLDVEQLRKVYEAGQESVYAEFELRMKAFMASRRKAAT